VVRVPGYRSIGPGCDSRRYQIFWEVVGLERGPLSLVSTIEELLGINSSGSVLENHGRGDPLPWPRDTLYPQKLALTSPTSGGLSVVIARLRTKATEFLLCYDRRAVSQSILVSSNNLGPRPDIYYYHTVAGFLMWGVLSDERAGLSFTIAALSCRCSHSLVWVPRDSWPYFTVSDSRLPQHGGPGPRIYSPKEQSGSIMPPGTGFHFRRFLRLAGLRWRLSNVLPLGDQLITSHHNRSQVLARTAQKTSFPYLHVLTFLGNQRVHRSIP
jgi:hypothetical protein